MNLIPGTCSFCNARSSVRKRSTPAAAAQAKWIESATATFWVRNSPNEDIHRSSKVRRSKPKDLTASSKITRFSGVLPPALTSPTARQLVVSRSFRSRERPNNRVICADLLASPSSRWMKTIVSQNILLMRSARLSEPTACKPPHRHNQRFPCAVVPAKVLAVARLIYLYLPVFPTLPFDERARNQVCSGK